MDFKESNIQEHVDRYTRGTKYDIWTDVICEMIDNVVSATIDNFCLRETAQNSSYRELEFIYPISSTTPYVEEVEYLPGYLKGIIDLVIKINSRYYIVDWKSNWLGNTIDSYSQEQMKSSVIDHQYFLQAALYKEALRRYLALVEQAPFDEIYGGTYYVYLRGISKDSKATGVIALDQQFSNAGALES